MGVVVNATAAGVVRGARHRATAEAWIDFLLSDGQQLFAELNYEYPILPAIPIHPLVHPLTDFRVADFDLALAVAELEATLDLMDRVGLP
jgi:iron(III) transport system substrate-binding protein